MSPARVCRRRSWSCARTGAARQKKLEYLAPNRVMLVYEMPLERDHLRLLRQAQVASRSGYASLDYELIGYRESDLVKLDILVNGEPVDALSLIVHKDKALRPRQACSSRS